MKRIRYQPYGRQREKQHPPEDRLWKLAGTVLMAVGGLLLFLCVPIWAWAAMTGAALVCAGWALISTCRR